MGIIKEFWYRTAQGEIKKFYHGTSAFAAHNIELDGVLKPRMSMQSGEDPDDFDFEEDNIHGGNWGPDPSREDCVYVTNDFSEALRYARAATPPNYPTAVIIVQADVDDLYLDEDEVGLILLNGYYPELAQEFLDQFSEDWEELLYGDKEYDEEFEPIPKDRPDIILKQLMNFYNDQYNINPENPSMFAEELKEFTRTVEEKYPEVKREILETSSTFCLKNEVPVLEVRYT